jgi:hypothetical protein
MIDHGESPERNDSQEQHSLTHPLGGSNSTKIVLNVIIGVLLIAVGYFSSAWIAPSNRSSAEEEKLSTRLAKVVQLDVLNGCGAKGAGAKFTEYLRTNGFDVVEMKNYKTFSVPQTLVVDRVGNLTAARRVAAALGVSDRNVIQQINPDYFVDVSVIVGADYENLRAAR